MSLHFSVAMGGGYSQILIDDISHISGLSREMYDGMSHNYFYFNVVTYHSHKNSDSTVPTRPLIARYSQILSEGISHVSRLE